MLSTRSLRTMAALVMLFAFTASPGGAQGDLDPDAIERGRVVYASTAGGVGCAACHGRFGLGDVGPAIRGASSASIASALTSVPDMEFITLASGDLDDLVTYLAHLGQASPMPVTLRGGDLSAAEVSVAAGETMQLIVTNADPDAYDILSEALGDHRLPARAVVDFFWTAPTEAGTYTVDFADGMGVAATLVMTVTPE